MSDQRLRALEAPEVSVSLARELVASQFPQWADLPLEPVALGGWDNRTFRLGEDMSVRLPSARCYAPQVAKEQRWLPILAPSLPLPIPAPLAQGAPSRAYPWSWSVYRWLEGESATLERLADPVEFARALADFLAALQRVDPAGGPPPGPHSFERGGTLATYERETRLALASLGGQVDHAAAIAVWEAGLAATWRGAPVWVHGDVSAANLLVQRGHLSAVIDFGCSAVGDPACDLTIAWTLLPGGEAREAFRRGLELDPETWARGRGWALWKALITLAEHRESEPAKAARARGVIEEVLAGHERAGSR